MGRYPEIDVRQVRAYSVAHRPSKVEVSDFARPHAPGQSFWNYWQSLPHILKGSDLRELVEHIVRGHRRGKPLIWMMGAHVIKCGLNPVVIDLMERGIITAVALNGAGSIHDVEVAYWGKTSEDVATNLWEGTFGMAQETAGILNDTIAQAKDSDMGFGEALGRQILQDKPPYQSLSILARGYQLGIPVTVHVAMGTDIVHQHPNADGEAIGKLSLRDFRILAHVVTQLGDGGVVLNLGSTVILPEVFLKALAVSQNLGHRVENFFTADFDMIRHYRPQVNVVQRPTQRGGKGYQFTGHHEILIPLLAAAIIETLARKNEEDS